MVKYGYQSDKAEKKGDFKTMDKANQTLKLHYECTMQPTTSDRRKK